MLFRRSECSHLYLSQVLEESLSTFPSDHSMRGRLPIYGHSSFLLRYIFPVCSIGVFLSAVRVLSDYFLHLLKSSCDFYPFLLMKNTSFRFVYVESVLCWDRSYLILMNGPSVCMPLNSGF